MPEGAEDTSRDPLWVRWALWTLIAAFIIGMGAWAFSTGMRMREDTWVYSRTIRFHYDIGNGLRWGDLVLRTAEKRAEADWKAAHPHDKSPHPAAVANPKPGAHNQRRLTFWEMIRGEDQVYQDLVISEPPDGSYGLDYPPMRLLVMTLWTRYLQSQYPNLHEWPGAWRIIYNAKGNHEALITEDIGWPMLMLNTYCMAAAAVLTFLLVCIWVNRGGRRRIGKRSARLIPWKPIRLSQSRGLLVFAISTPAFFYMAAIAESPAPPGPPAVSISGRPDLSKSVKGTVAADISARVNGEGVDAQWQVEWGTTPLYGHKTELEDVANEDVTTTLIGLPPYTTIHYRVVARNDLDLTRDFGRGTTRTDDQTFNTSDALAPLPSSHVYGELWPAWTQWVGIGLIFLVMIWSITVLPPWHRAWAAGLVAALLMWFEPSDLTDSIVWPQWDVWMLPPFLLAALLGSVDWWLSAGLVLGAGVMFKGQTLAVAPILLLWPLFSGRWGAAARLTLGFILMAGLILFPWLALGNQPPNWAEGALRWIPGVVVAAVIAAALSLYRGPVMRRARAMFCPPALPVIQERGETSLTATEGPHPSPDYGSTKLATGRERGQEEGAPGTSLLDLCIFCASLLGGIVLVTLLVLRQWPSDSELARGNGLFLILALLVPPWFLRKRKLGIWLLVIVTASIWMSAYLYHGDWTWKTVGFEYGARKFTRMALGVNSNGNFPRILEVRWGWEVHDPAMTLHPPDLADWLHLVKRTGWIHDWGLDGTPVVLDIRQFLMAVFVVLTLLTGAGAAIQSRRNDPRFLASLVSMWILMPNVLCQMTARYQMWGAALASMAVAFSPGLTIWHVVMSLIAAGMCGAQELDFDQSRSPLLHDLMNRFAPDDAWLMLVGGLMFLYVALAPSRRPSDKELAKP